MGDDLMRIALVVGLVTLLGVDGCVPRTPPARSELDEIKERQAAARTRLDALQKDIAAAEERARAARAAAEFENCRAQVARIKSDVALLQAQCVRSVAAQNICVAENEKKTATSGTAGCAVGILIAVATGGAAAPWGLGGCAVGLAAGAATAQNCPFQACEVNEEKLTTASLFRTGLTEFPRCGGYVGASLAPLPARAPGGLEVTGVGPGTTAQELGLAPHDILVRVQGIDIISDASVELALSSLKPGDSVEVDVVREGRRVRTSGIARTIDAWGKASSKVRLGFAYHTAPLKDVPYSEGFMVSTVEAQGPAAAGGLRPADYVVTINGKVVATETALRDALDLPAESLAEFQIARLEGKSLTNLKISVRLAARAGRKGW